MGPKNILKTVVLSLMHYEKQIKSSWKRLDKLHAYSATVSTVTYHH